MSDVPAPEKPPEQNDSNTGDFVALGIGCLVTILMIGSALYYGFAGH